MSQQAGEKLEDVRAQREFLYQLSRNPATESGSLTSVARLVTESCARLLRVERVGVWLFDDRESELVCVDQYNLSTGGHSSGAVLHEHEFATEFQALKTSLFVDASDPCTDPRTAGYVDGYIKPNRISSMLDLVIRFGGKNLGTLCFEHVDEPHVWEPHEIDFGCMAGAQLSILLERRELKRIEERLTASRELDALKSRFFAGVSHELRTPLTLLLGPVEDLLASAQHPPSAWQREQLTAAHRGALRLLKLVNALLDFVRIEAGRFQPVFEPTDLAVFTRELAGLFESLAAVAGLRLRIDCAELPEPVYVDRDLWEKIVLNLISNALKFTFEGEISVTLSASEDRVALVVKDSGVGIPARALPQIFERFYRVPDARARTVEGVGIGLALVKELVELHGGTIEVESTTGSGSSFRVEIPRGRAHLLPEQVRERSGDALLRGVSPLVEEALGWMPAASDGEATDAAAEATGDRARIVLADDNADMRAYLVRLLSDRYEVEACADGAAALEAARARLPDLVLSDVMMPRLDGVGLLRELRADPGTRTVPVLLLSARAGEDAAVEALAVGADDYIAKPFSARELLARVGTRLDLARARREAAESDLKDVFLGIAAHELKTPLTSLKLRVHFARNRLVETGQTRAAEPLAGVDRSIARMERLVEDLISVSAIKLGKLSLVREPCDLTLICREIAAEASAGRRSAVTLELPAAPVVALVDRERIGEAVGHLLSNAFKYSPASRPVTLSLRDEGAEAVIAVRDEGPGIPAESIPRLFERFYQVPGTAVQAGSSVGLGLGLSIARAIVEQHGGAIRVESSPGRGSIFFMTLPRGDDPEGRWRTSSTSSSR